MYQPPYPPANRPPFPPPVPPPAVDPSELRPRRVWYVVAALVAGILVGAGIVIFVVGIVTATGTAGSFERRFDAGETVTVRLESQPRSAIYARIPYQGDGSNPVPTPQAQCSVVDSAGQKVELDAPTGTFTVTRGGVSWREIYEVGATEPGDHRISCRSSDTGGFAVGEAPDTGKLVGGIAGGLVGLFVLPLTGILIGVVISVVVAVRRTGCRRRILAQRYPPQY